MTVVSVVLPTHRRPNLLTDAIASVLQQTYTQLELIVVYGGSQSETAEVLESVDDDRLHTIAHEQPQGIAAARNAGLEIATGQYIVFLDDDDYLFKIAIETLVKTIQNQPADCAGVYAGRVDSYPSGRKKIRHVPEGRIDKYENIHHVAPSCTLFRAEAVDEIGGFDESFPAAEDHDLVVRLLSKFHLLHLDEILYKRRHHNEQLTKDHELLLKGDELLLKKHWEKFTDTARADRLARIAEHYCKLEDKENARQTVKRIEKIIDQSDDILSGANIAGANYRLAHLEAKLENASAARGQLRRAIRRNANKKGYWFYYFWLLFGTLGYKLGRTVEYSVYNPIVSKLGTHIPTSRNF